MSHVRALRCRKCGREYKQQPVNLCEFCFGSLEVVYDYESIARVISREKIAAGPLNIWRYKELLPVEDVIDINPGYTPLIRADNLGRRLGLEHLYLKNDCTNPTYSFKDRVVSVAISKALEFGFSTVACASTGNLACSVAAHAAKARLKAYVFVPSGLEAGKIVGAAIYGPRLIFVEGNYDDVNHLCTELANRYDWAFVNINLRPYYAEGSKTIAYEVAEQLGWRAPEHAVAPAASGSLFTKIWKGLNEWSSLGLIAPVRTKMHLAQASGCSPIVNAFAQGTLNIIPVRPNTIAKSIAIGNPADGYYALKTIQESEGSACAVSDEEIVEGMKLLAETEGIFAETAGGVVIASLKRLVASGAIKSRELTVAIITGSGLKTQEAIENSVAPKITIQPTLSSFEQALHHGVMLT